MIHLERNARCAECEELIKEDEEYRAKQSIDDTGYLESVYYCESCLNEAKDHEDDKNIVNRRNARRMLYG